MKGKCIAAGLALVVSCSAPAWAIDGVALEGGNGDHVDRVQAALQWDWKKPLLQFSTWQVGGYWDVSLGYWWRSNVAPGEHKDLFDLGFTPVFRVQPNSLTGPYVEAGIGAHVLSHSSIGDKHMSTAFQFGDHIGVGYRFGVKRAFDLSYRFQHLSNAGIKEPNPGINFNMLRLQYRF